MIEFAGLTILVLLACGVLALSLVLLKAVLWLALLPFRLLVYALVLPLVFVLKAVLGGVFFLVLAPELAIAALASLVALAAALIVPLLPLLFIVLGVWLVVRLTRGAPAPTRALAVRTPLRRE